MYKICKSGYFFNPNLQATADVAPQLKEMGIPVDLEGNADTIATSLYPNGLGGKAVSVEKKIYPNDPCPCGSGKKYKKCCLNNYILANFKIFTEK